MEGETRLRRSPSLELIDRPPSLYRPPIRSIASPRLSTQEVDELTNPNLPYRTGYTYAFSKSYRNSSSYDDYEVPNMAGTSFYHDSSIRDDDEDIGTHSSITTTIYEEAITVYYKIITAVYCSLATTYAGGRSLAEWIYYILYSIAYGAWYAVSQGGQLIGESIYRILYSIGYGLWVVLDSTGRVSYNGSSALLATLFDIVMYLPRTVHAYVTAPSSKRVTYNDDDNEVRYFAKNESIAFSNGPSSSSSSSTRNQRSVFGGLWSSALKYLKRGRRSHMEPVYELRSRTIEREVGDTDTDDELGLDDHHVSTNVNVVRHAPVQRRIRSTKQLNEHDVIQFRKMYYQRKTIQLNNVVESDELERFQFDYRPHDDVYDDSGSILINILYLPIDAIVALYNLVCYSMTSLGSGVKNAGYYGATGTKSTFEGLYNILTAIVFYTLVKPISAAGSFVRKTASSLSQSDSNGYESPAYVVHHSSSYGAAVHENDENQAPAVSTHSRQEDEDILAGLVNAPRTRRSTRVVSTPSTSSRRHTGAVTEATTALKSARSTRSSKIAPISTASSSSVFASSQSSSLFAPVGGIVWAVKDSTTTMVAKIIDVVTFSYLLIFQCFRAIGQLIADGASTIVSSVSYIFSSLASGATTGSSGILSMIGAAIGVILSVCRDVVVESWGVMANTTRAIGRGAGAIWGSRPSGSTLWNVLLWLLLLLPLLLFCLWFFALPPFRKEHDEIVVEYVKHASSIMEDYYAFGQHHTKSFLAVTVDTIVAGARSIWTIFGALLTWIMAAIIGLWEAFIMFFAGLRVDRLFAPSPSPPLSPPPIIPPIIAPSIECPPSPPPVYIPSPPSTIDQEALVAAIVAKVTAQMETRMADSLNGRFHIIEESVKKAEEELRTKITVAHEPIDYTNLDMMIAAAIRKYDSDKTGLVDYALESAGGQIVSTRCSETYALSTRVEKIFNIPLYYSNYGPRVVIQRNSQALVPGECWAFKGGIGYLTIKLAVPIKVTSVSYEHIPKSISRLGENKSAPQKFSIFAYEKDEYDFASRHEVGKYVYDAHGDPLQFFPVQSPPPYPVQYIEFQVDSNFGEEYTCIYRFRVHGDNVKL